MLVLSMNSKRQRRPNVRLGEIGDVSAAFACGFSQRNKEDLGLKRYRMDFLSTDEIESDPNCGISEKIHADGLVSDPGVYGLVSDPGVSPKADAMQNRENKNPNSTKLDSEQGNLDEADMNKPKLNSWAITRKCRIMKRRGRTTKENNDAFGSVWCSKLGPQLSNGDQKECSTEEFGGFAPEACSEYPDAGFEEFSDNEVAATSKEASDFDMDEPICVGQEGNFHDSGQEEAFCEGDNESPLTGHVWDEMKFRNDYVLPVKRWLEKQGFGKFADLFELHEVDEETLPLLTLEDLKEIGVFAVGPRRKLYTAIQRLRNGIVSA